VHRRLTYALAGGLAALAAATPATALADGPKVEKVELRDACNKASFDATFGPGICQRNAGSVSGPEFLSKLNPKDFGHGAWWINASGGRVGTTNIKVGDTLRITNQGGENHTFTPVERYSSATSFTGGCVPPLSQPLGLTAFPGDCGKALAETVVGPGTTFDLKGLGAGTYHFQCVIHPWMRQTVKVARS
jgi:plastocyanin